MDKNKILSKNKKNSLYKTHFLNSNSSKDKYTDFSKFELYKQIEFARKISKKLNISSPFFKCFDSLGSSIIKYNGEDYINFSSYNYLNLNGHNETLKAVNASTEKLGTSVSASRFISGERCIHTELEKEIAALYEVESALTFVSGHATNVTVISCLFGVKDLILYDAISHNCIIQGIKLSDAKAYAFKHNDNDHLEFLLHKYRNRYERVLIVTEGLFSMDGDVPDLPKLIEIKNRYKAFLMIDEAHSLGVLGASGKGIYEYYNLDSESVDIWMGTLSKTLCSCGGYIAGKAELIDILKYHAAGFVYSVGMTPMNASAALCSLKLLKKSETTVKKIQYIGGLFLEKLKNHSFNTGNSIGYGIIPVIIGSSQKAVELSNILFDQYKINVNPIGYPAVEERKARLRFFINSQHTEEQIDYVISALDKYGKN
ncbi:MAG TPA: aminotransferase class I/II-fold pyridoxal phosphate-dependent enzyme [Victivallales bacterium]|nr:aminotransferase class I/II-fold pyridoxal phosphate-dependent enzyme [Victivallales bacterium]